MTLLKVCARNFKNLADDVEIDFVAKARKTSEDKEYELHEIADNLYVYTTMAFVGKNASGKTTALDLLKVAYDILSGFRADTDYSVDGTEICVFFYHDKYIYKYVTTLSQRGVEKTICFENEALLRKKYYSSYYNKIYDEDDFEEYMENSALPEDVSKVFLVMKTKSIGALYYDDSLLREDVYDLAFRIMQIFDIRENVLRGILRVFDENITDLSRDDKGNYRLTYIDEDRMLSPQELFRMMSSGTTKGVFLYMVIIASLKSGIPLIIDEIENHFHKTLVENVISLYKDKTINRNNAMLIFSTHYCELLDLFNRQDNIYVANAEKKVYLNSIYDKYGFRNDVLKSKQFYNGVFKTSVNYDALMDLKKVLK